MVTLPPKFILLIRVISLFTSEGFSALSLRVLQGNFNKKVKSRLSYRYGMNTFSTLRLTHQWGHWHGIATSSKEQTPGSIRDTEVDVHTEAEAHFPTVGGCCLSTDGNHLHAYARELLCVAVSSLQFIEMQNSSVKGKKWFMTLIKRARQTLLSSVPMGIGTTAGVQCGRGIGLSSNYSKEMRECIAKEQGGGWCSKNNNKIPLSKF